MHNHVIFWDADRFPSNPLNDPNHEVMEILGVTERYLILQRDPKNSGPTWKLPLPPALKFLRGK